MGGHQGEMNAFPSTIVPTESSQCVLGGGRSPSPDRLARLMSGTNGKACSLPLWQKKKEIKLTSKRYCWKCTLWGCPPD